MLTPFMFGRKTEGLTCQSATAAAR